MCLAIKYLLFAAIASAVNIGSQYLTNWAVVPWSGELALLLSIGVGTLTGLVVKYVLDKRYIFMFKARSLGDDSRKFILYTLMGLATTAVFWGTELGFQIVFGGQTMRYVGAAIGLGVGYWIKYRLDKRFVFTEKI